MSEPETVALHGEHLAAEISTLGAELRVLKDEAGRDLLWDGDPAFWTGRSPLLFPIVGRVKDDHIRVGGAAYPMRQHGIARTASFEVVERSASAARLRLTDNEATRAAYPFAFELDVTYTLEGPGLQIEARVRNPGDVTLPCSFGFHPALRWPLPYGAKRETHVIRFDQAEPEPLRALQGGLIAEETRPTPVAGNVLTLRDDLFTADALIFDRPRSRRVTYRGAEGRGLVVAYEHMPQLGIWSKPGAGFVCIEPWQGFASPAGFDGELADKPGIVHVAPGESRGFGMSIALAD